jgi:hypothetical protein
MLGRPCQTSLRQTLESLHLAFSGNIQDKVKLGQVYLSKARLDYITLG